MFIHDKLMNFTYPVLVAENEVIVSFPDRKIYLIGSSVNTVRFAVPTAWAPIYTKNVFYVKPGFNVEVYNRVAHHEILLSMAEKDLPYKYYRWIADEQFESRYQLVDEPSSNEEALSTITEEE